MTTSSDLSIEEIRAIEAARLQQKRARQRRDELSRHVDVLDELDAGAELPSQPTRADVANFFDVDPARLSRLLNSHADEFAEDGWRPDHPHRRAADLWSMRAIVRMGLLLDCEWDPSTFHRPHTTPNPVAAQLRYLLGHGNLPAVYSTEATRISQCAALHAKATRIVEHVHNEDPAVIWAELQQAERYELQALVVALAAAVPIDQHHLTRWLQEISGRDGEGGSVAKGLALLIPQPNTLYRRRATGRSSRRRRKPNHAAVQ
ncbi:MAG: hypothetical protein K2X52_06580 [Mycobacteriaceae bacterium]|nr:hypothetical protein [Mycobacteriaceae bacterium]